MQEEERRISEDKKEKKEKSEAQIEKKEEQIERKTEGMVPEREYRAVVQVFIIFHLIHMFSYSTHPHVFIFQPSTGFHNIPPIHMFPSNLSVTHIPSHPRTWSSFSPTEKKLRKSRTLWQNCRVQGCKAEYCDPLSI